MEFLFPKFEALCREYHEFLQNEQNSNWIVFGGSGFLGKWIVTMGNYARRRGIGPKGIIVCSRNPTLANQSISSFSPSFSEMTEVLDYESLIERHQKIDFRRTPETLIFFAASPTSNQNFDDQTGTKYLQKLLDLPQKGNIPRVVHLSSGAVYGHQARAHALIPEDLGRIGIELASDEYTKQKIQIEMIIEDKVRKGSIIGISPRLFSFGGPGMNLKSQHALTSFVRDAMENNSIIISGNPATTRSYLHPIDLVRFLFASSQNISKLSNTTLHIGSSIALTMKEIASEVARCFGAKEIICQCLEIQANHYVPITDKTSGILGIKQFYSLRDILNDWKKYLQQI